MVDNYRIQHAYSVDTKNPEYKAPWNHIANIPRVYTPADTAIQTPNSDTPYSMLGLDLRAEPLVLTVPPIEKDRYFSVHSSMRIRTTPPISAAARPETMAATSSSPDPAGRARRRRA